MLKSNVLSSVRKAIKTSCAATASVAVRKAALAKAGRGRRRSVLFGNGVKPVSIGCIAALEACGCECTDWSRVLVIPGFDPVNVVNTRFIDDVVLGNFQTDVELTAGVHVPAGIRNSTVSNCEIGNNCLISDVGLLANYVVGDDAVVSHCDMVATRTGATFGNGIELPIAIETGGRELLSFAEMTVADAETVCTSRTNKKLLADYERLIKQYVDAVTSDVGTIEAGARVVSTPKVLDVYVGAAAVIDNARLVEGVTMLSGPDEKTTISDGAFVRNSILQWGCKVTSMAIVNESVMVEHSHVERHAMVTQSLLGPNTGVAEGEITASLCGPFVGFHHQSLLIATFWPEGKGNISYGADVGSNHTSRAPDQEFFPGEGTFFGLGVNIKFPSDFTRAPYSIFATAVSTLPQRLAFPFSLISPPAASVGMSPAYNEIMPAWVLSDNIFAIRRNEGKYKKRDKARRSTFVFDIFRPDVVELMLNARKRLQHPDSIRELYTDVNIEGLGKNYMFEETRLKAIETYTFYIRYYALLALKARLESTPLSKSKLKTLLSKRTGGGRRWQHERKVLLAEFGADADLVTLLKTLSKAQQQIAHDTQKSKEKDDQRGARIIADYAEAHSPATENAFVKETWEVTRKMQKEIRTLIKKLQRK